MTDSNEIPALTREELITLLLEMKRIQMVFLETNASMQNIFTKLLTPTFKAPSPERENKGSANKITDAEKTHVNGILKQITKDRENLARKAVAIEKIQDVLDAHYGWEDEKRIDD